MAANQASGNGTTFSSRWTILFVAWLGFQFRHKLLQPVNDVLDHYETKSVPTSLGTSTSYVDLVSAIQLTREVCSRVEYIFFSDDYGRPILSRFVFDALRIGNIFLVWVVVSNVGPILAILWRWAPSKAIFFLLFGSWLTGTLDLITNILTNLDLWPSTFGFLFIFKFLKAIIHYISGLIYVPTPVPDNPTFKPIDVTVIIPTTGAFDKEFVHCIRSILSKKPREILVTTVGAQRLREARAVLDPITREVDLIHCIGIPEASKREQIARAIQEVSTAITCIVDAHVFWPANFYGQQDGFLEAALAPFQDPLVGHVSLEEKALRDDKERKVPRTWRQFWEWMSADFWNYSSCIYLERHNFEATAATHIDYGLPPISGPTTLLRTSILQSSTFIEEYVSSRWGPNLLTGSTTSYSLLNTDSQDFITRYVLTSGFKTVFQAHPATLIHSSLGATHSWNEFLEQSLRTARTAWRTNYAILFVDRAIWARWWWSVYALYLSALVNLSLIYDPLLLYTLYRSGYWSKERAWTLVGLLLGSKLVKPLRHCRQYPWDIWRAVVYGIWLSYAHSLLKLWAVWTINDVSGIEGPQGRGDGYGMGGGWEKDNWYDSGAEEGIAAWENSSSGRGSGRMSRMGKTTSSSSSSGWYGSARRHEKAALEETGPEKQARELRELVGRMRRLGKRADAQAFETERQWMEIRSTMR